MKVGQNRQQDYKRAALIRKFIGDDCDLMTDANQNWGADEAIDWMRPMAEFRPLWIEEPTSPDDVLGTKNFEISKSKTFLRFV
jgi:L-fuconate dehydratase